MEVEKKRLKGSFLHLFDWNGKSRKKLFSNNLDLDDEPKNGKENVGKMAKSLLHVIEIDESRASSSNKASSDCNCASSVTSDEGYGSRAPGVVARLMGLDSLPTSNVPEPFSTPYSDARALRASHYNRNISNLWSENHSVEYIKVPNKEWFRQNNVDSRVLKRQSRPIERFQTEMLPPKSAKSIPITHHKLLSPIKSPGFIPTKNTAYVMEAAAKIIEASPQATTKDKRPQLVPSVPLGIWDLKEKIEGAQTVSRPQKSNESVSARYTKGQHIHQSYGGSVYPAVKAPVHVEKRNPENTKKKENFVSVTTQAKVSVQRKEGSSSSSNRSSTNQKEKMDVKANQFVKSQPDTRRTAQNQTSGKRTTNVLKQNNQKQNYTSNNDTSTSKTSVLNHQGRKVKSTSGTIGPKRAVNRVVTNAETGSRKTGLTTNNAGNDLSSSKVKNLCQRKQSAIVNTQSEESSVDNELNKKDESSVKCTVEVEASTNWGADNRNKGIDVVSFTFSSPIRSTGDSQSSSQVMERNCSFNIDSFANNNKKFLKNSTVFSPGFNGSAGDALSVLVEQKLRELTSKIESSHSNMIQECTTGSTASNLQDSMTTLDAISTKSPQHGKRVQLVLHKDTFDDLDNSSCSSINPEALSINQKWQYMGSEETEMHSSSSNKDDAGTEDCQSSSTMSSLEPSVTSMSCSDSRNESRHFLLAQDQAEFSLFPTNLSVLMDEETELSDSTSSILVGNIGKGYMSRSFSFIDSAESSSWELEYLREMLDNTDLMVHEFALGQTDQVIASNLLNHLENQKNKLGSNGDEYSKLGRKVLFDYVSECLNYKGQQFFFRSCKGWSKCVTLFQRKDWLAEELYKGIRGWNNMRDLMVDELIDKDMSSQYGKWVDFEIEAFEEGTEMANSILTSLVDELVSDFLVF
ncbi:uncharacterized protein LOC123220172 isoform X2 [Mangifera indica]|uniref:uncharacterized protein LOC123220172 isoform X2 n=1 Tax=Mangifera indica TaxID=29780 RepID=UPI001CFA0507|nr:uncharacterized protein LOC123220172 isoform X2 [Mangifera indica]